MRRQIAYGVTLSLCLTLAASAPSRAQQCVGDCNGDGVVTVGEVITGVNVELGIEPESACPAIDCNHFPGIIVLCAPLAVSNALNGCH